MTASELSRLDIMYRRVTVHLAQVATRTRDASLVRYLNDLVASAHGIIYVVPKKSAGSWIWRFIHKGFSEAVARMWRYNAVSALLLIFGLILGYFAVQQNPMAAYAIMPAGEFRQAGATQDQLLDALRHGRQWQGGIKFFFTSFLFNHNVKVGLLAMTMGVLAAVPTILLTVYNGMILGAFTAVHHGSGIYAEYWAWILPHGVTELTAIVLCGGIGLRLGCSVVRPGMLSRQESLRLAGLEAARTILGVAGMLLIAAIIEGYLRQSHLSTLGRFVFAGSMFVFWLAYFSQGFLPREGCAPGAPRTGSPEAR